MKHFRGLRLHLALPGLHIFVFVGMLIQSEVIGMINIAIVDDERNILSELTQNVKRYFADKDISYDIATFLSGTELLLKQVPFDLIFLDISMEGPSGMEVAEQLRQNKTGGFIVFITALQEYVYDAFEVEASDYLLKPIDDARFMRTMDRVCHNIQNADTGSLLIPSRGNTYQVVLFRDIYYIEAVNHRVEFYMEDSVHEGYFKVAELAELLDGRFFQCHRSYFVNLDYVCGYDNGLALLGNGSRIPVSRLRSREFSKAVLCYMAEKRLR